MVVQVYYYSSSRLLMRLIRCCRVASRMLIERQSSCLAGYFGLCLDPGWEKEEHETSRMMLLLIYSVKEDPSGRWLTGGGEQA